MNRACISTLIAAALAVSAGGCGSETDDGADAANAKGPAGLVGTSLVSTSHVPPPPDDKHPIVVLRTSLGEVTLKLNAEKAPSTVRNFLHYVSSGHYNGTIFHQVEPGYVALGGGYQEGLIEKPGRYPIANEAANGLKNRRGTIAMARQLDDINSSTCQFFLNLADNPNLDHSGTSPEKYGFCVFGEVIDGFDTLDRLAALQVHNVQSFTNVPVETVLLETVRRTR